VAIVTLIPIYTKAGNPPRNYGFQVASDAFSRDGIGCELWELDADEVLAEVFRDDTLKQLSFTVFKPIDIPLEVLDRLLQIFNEIPGRVFIEYDSPEYHA
jgi:hypothetical protein